LLSTIAEMAIYKGDPDFAVLAHAQSQQLQGIVSFLDPSSYWLNSRCASDLLFELFFPLAHEMGHAAYNSEVRLRYYPDLEYERMCGLMIELAQKCGFKQPEYLKYLSDRYGFTSDGEEAKRLHSEIVADAFAVTSVLRSYHAIEKNNGKVTLNFFELASSAWVAQILLNTMSICDLVAQHGTSDYQVSGKIEMDIWCATLEQQLRLASMKRSLACILEGMWNFSQGEIDSLFSGLDTAMEGFVIPLNGTLQKTIRFCLEDRVVGTEWEILERCRIASQRQNLNAISQAMTDFLARADSRKLDSRLLRAYRELLRNSTSPLSGAFHEELYVGLCLSSALGSGELILSQQGVNAFFVCSTNDSVTRLYRLVQANLPDDIEITCRLISARSHQALRDLLHPFIPDTIQIVIEGCPEYARMFRCLEEQPFLCFHLIHDPDISPTPSPA
jgi:hypothetical protein